MDIGGDLGEVFDVILAPLEVIVRGSEATGAFAQWLREEIPALAVLHFTGEDRAVSNPAYHAAALTASSTRQHLQRLCALENHVFWPADISLLDADVLTAGAFITHRQLTDVYLLALAVKHGGCLATFDTSIPLSVVKGASSKHLLVLGT